MSTWYNRHRSVGPTTSNGSVHYRYRIGNCSNNDLTVQSEGDSSVNSTYSLEEMYDVVTPNFRARMRAGEIINNPYIHTWTSWNRGTVNWTGSRTKNCPTTTYADYEYTGVSFGNISDLLPSDSDFLQNLTLDASTAAQAKLYASAVQSLVILGQFRETLSLLSEPLGGISKIYGRHRGKRGTSLSEALSSSWLASRFGWRPLMHDIEDIMDAVVERNGPRLTARAKASGSTSESDSRTITDMSHAGCTSVRDVTHSYSVRCGILAEIEKTAGYNTGLRLRDIPQAAWELLPFSFVADWFLGIGNYLGAIIPGSNVRILAKWTTSDVISNQTETITPGQYSNYTNKPTAPVSHTRYFRVKQRAPGLVPPGIAWRTNSIDRLLSLQDWRVLDIIALIASRGSRTKFARSG